MKRYFLWTEVSDFYADSPYQDEIESVCKWYSTVCGTCELRWYMTDGRTVTDYDSAQRESTFMARYRMGEEV